jgi:hypothetical protein
VNGCTPILLSTELTTGRKKDMITAIIAGLITPASLATAPMNIPAVETKYDWGRQTSVSSSAGVPRPMQSGTFMATTSLAPDHNSVVQDDYNSD